MNNRMKKKQRRKRIARAVDLMGENSILIKRDGRFIIRNFPNGFSITSGPSFFGGGKLLIEGYIPDPITASRPDK